MFYNIFCVFFLQIYTIFCGLFFDILWFLQKYLIVCGFYKKNICSTTVFNIDNNKKCFLINKSAYVEDHVTLKTRIMMLKN